MRYFGVFYNIANRARFPNVVQNNWNQSMLAKTDGG